MTYLNYHVLKSCFLDQIVIPGCRFASFLVHPKIDNDKVIRKGSLHNLCHCQIEFSFHGFVIDGLIDPAEVVSLSANYRFMRALYLILYQYPYFAYGFRRFQYLGSKRVFGIKLEETIALKCLGCSKSMIRIRFAQFN